uniref:Uncharacterized protein n=1 Tax=Caulobacter phage BL57 TaxID=3348355 RepID=A0AB74UK95_9VIRU
MFASVTLPARDAQGLSLDTVHAVFRLELAQHFEHVISAPSSTPGPMRPPAPR